MFLQQLLSLVLIIVRVHLFQDIILAHGFLVPKLTVAICFETFYTHFHDVWDEDVNQNKISVYHIFSHTLNLLSFHGISFNHG